MKERCEDAPCCGCCGVNVYGVNQEDGDPRSDQEIKDAVLARMSDPNFDDDHPDDMDELSGDEYARYYGGDY
jgi:hypothetical protein